MSNDSVQIREQVLYLHRQGMRPGDIAKALDITKQMVSYHKKELGLQLPRFKVTPALKDEMKFLLDEGYRVCDVARRLGVTSKTVYRLFPRPKEVVSKITAVEAMLDHPVNRFLAMPWTSGEEIETVFIAKQAVP